MTTTLHLYRRVRIPPFAAAAAFDAFCRPATTPVPLCTLVAPSAVLTLAATEDVTGDGPSFALRSAIGRLRPASGWDRFAVEVDVTPWSRAETMIGLRPRGRLAPVSDGRRQQRYLGLADAMTEHLAARIACTVASWEHDVVAEAATLMRTAVGT